VITGRIESFPEAQVQVKELTGKRSRQSRPRPSAMAPTSADSRRWRRVGGSPSARPAWKPSAKSTPKASTGRAWLPFT